MLQIIGVCCYWASLFKYNFSDIVGTPQTSSSQGFPSSPFPFLGYSYIGAFFVVMCFLAAPGKREKVSVQYFVHSVFYSTLCIILSD